MKVDSSVKFVEGNIVLYSIKAVCEFLAKIPGVRVTQQRESSGVDFVLKVASEVGDVFLIGDVKGRGLPGEIASIAHRLKAVVLSDPSRKSVPFLVVPRLTEGAADVCRELGISWMDLAGNCDLRWPGMYVEIRGRSITAPKITRNAALYTPKAARVVHALLLDPMREWRTTDLYQATGVSLGQVAKVKSSLASQGWVESSYGRLVLTRPRKLLDDWARQYRPLRREVRYFSLEALFDIEKRFSQSVPAGTLTEFAAAERYAPYTYYQRLAFYVPEWPSSLAKDLGLRPAEGGANVTVYESLEGGLFSEERAGTRIASPIRTYLDLTLLGGRGQDAAEHLLEVAILPRWS